ncbi:MAG: cysteine-rich CWC family protein [Aquabacterium sp.]
MNPQPALPNKTCPLCGQANQCAPAASGDLHTPCWCRQATFSAELLAKVPEGQRGLACICAACAKAHEGPRPIA